MARSERRLARHGTIESDGEIDRMVAKLIRDPCPRCSHLLRISRKHIGKRVECKFCGHCFRVRAEPEPEAGPGGEPAQAPDLPRSLELVLQKTWEDLTARQARM